MPLKQIYEPFVEPVSVAEVLDAARADDAALSGQAAIAIKALRRHAEARIGRALITQTMELSLDAFPVGEIDLVLPNVRSIDSVRYLALDAAEQTLPVTAYSLETDNAPSWLFPAFGEVWPETLAAANAVRVRFTVGYGDTSADVPEDIRMWIIAHATQMLASPDGLIEQSFKPLPFIDRLLDPYISYRAQ